MRGCIDEYEQVTKGKWTVGEFIDAKHKGAPDEEATRQWELLVDRVTKVFGFVPTGSDPAGPPAAVGRS